MTQKIAVITGANSGIGFETALGMAEAGYVVVMACRCEDRAESACRRILKRVPNAQLDILLLDLSSLVLIRKFAAEFRTKYDHLDILINNAGILRYNGERTEDGFEAQLGVNYLGHFLLSSLLIDMMPDSSKSRVISIGSVAHKSAVIDLDDLNYEWRLKFDGAYNQSKLACLMFSDELQRRLGAAGKEILSVCAHPGGTDTGIFDAVSRPYYYFMKLFVAPFVTHSNESAAQPLICAALGTDIMGGEYIGPQGIMDLKGPPGRARRTEYSKDASIAKRLWDESEKHINCKFII